MSLEIISALIIVICIGVWHLSKRERRNLINKFPGPPDWPIIGNALDLLVTPEDFVALLFSYHKKWPKHFRIWLGPLPFLYLYNAQDIETILSSSTQINKASLYTLLQPWLGTGLLTSNGRKWQTRRKLLTPAFHFRILEDFIPVFNEQSDTLIEILNQNIHKPSFDIFPLIVLCSFDIICESAMGVKVNAQINSESPYIKALERIKDIIHKRMYRFYLWPDAIFNLTPTGVKHARCVKVLHSFSEKVIQERKIIWKENKSANIEVKKRLAFLDLLFDASDNGNNLSDSDIQEEVNTFMFEGHDTTAVGISWALFLLGHDQQIQQKAHDELRSIFGDDQSRHATSDDLKRMKYLECIIKETLRLFPSVPELGRTLTSDVVFDGDKVLPSGAGIGVIPLLLHRDPTVFPDPEKFDPDRFLPENCLNRNPFAYIPFSAGPRNCIGQKFAMLELKMVISRILLSYSIESIIPRDKITFTSELMIMPKHGILVHLTPRVTDI